LGTYHSPDDGPSPIGGLVVDGVQYDFTSWIYPFALPSLVTCFACSDTGPPVHYQVVRVFGNLGGVTHSITVTDTSNVQAPFCAFPGNFNIPTYCGDGTVQSSVDEECDDGNTNNDDGCTTLCKFPACGDSFLQSSVGEECDDGNTVATDACTSACKNAVCGDGFVHTGFEQCDDGNTNNADSCSNICNTAACGDGIVQAVNEQCDDGNTVATDSCTAECKNAVCGDGIVQTGVEQCDDGNSENTDSCTNTCKNAICGDGLVYSDVEQCDDGNTANTDACTNACNNAVCGDGFVQDGVEQCDDANTDNTDACTSVCKTAVCGDGYIRTGVEECDDANVITTDGCNNCKINTPPNCDASTLSTNTGWDPSHNFIDLTIVGVTDQENDPLTVVVTSVSQDEPVIKNGAAGNTCPDANITTGAPGHVAVRNEREGSSNGRVYSVSFLVLDPSGNSCSKTFTYCVPKSQGEKFEDCVNDGATYDSTVCTQNPKSALTES
jgi:cysteine-rich repeat protein